MAWLSFVNLDACYVECAPGIRALCPCRWKSELTGGVTNSITLIVGVAKVTISIEAGLLKKVDRLVKERVFSNRSQAVQSAVEEKISRLDSNRLARECAKLNKTEEQSLADLGLASETEEWLEY
jgi:Arc/MetJ-type ribon-helix-helix transcriptional regulator